jgi:hypothetical protein
MPAETRDAAWDAAAKADYLANDVLPDCGPWPDGVEFIAAVTDLCPICGLQSECYRGYLIWWKREQNP